jgi:hypothetical protein
MMSFLGSVKIFGNSMAPYANLVTVGVFVAGFLFSYCVRRPYRWIKRKILIRKSPSSNAVAIVVGIGGKLDPKPPAEEYLNKHCPKVPILVEYRKPGFLSPDEIIGAVENVRDAVADLQSSRRYISEVLLFYAGPISVALAIGAMFANWVPVRVFQFNDGKYSVQYILNRSLIKGVTRSHENKTQITHS